ncbi:hypothetical protein HPP92_005776 [Vanilla planifolia]|uniref:Uncharacterized protein n=1 Tax=Vanilla planifolia TaxID=51239 RepID=A0A835VDI4_VANPL|nr:hypothetical protein HPP92_005776 [Vanilla planifolia]
MIAVPSPLPLPPPRLSTVYHCGDFPYPTHPPNREIARQRSRLEKLARVSRQETLPRAPQLPGAPFCHLFPPLCRVRKRWGRTKQKVDFGWRENVKDWVQQFSLI